MMVIATLAGAALVLSVAAGPLDGSTGPAVRMTIQQKSAAMQPLIRSATECIARRVATDPRFSKQTQSGNLGDLIVDSMPSCAGPVRAMIDAFDRYFGDGTGEAFFMGPYLDVLPNAVTKAVLGIAK
jgi:hypothetical protein